MGYANMVPTDKLPKYYISEIRQTEKVIHDKIKCV